MSKLVFVPHIGSVWMSEDDQRKSHQPWCAKVIAANAELPWTVRCDCKTKKKRAAAEPYREVGWLGGFDVEPTK